ncbi:MAG: membrane dipeptidase [Gammaproteobacteria bacterium]|nr:membrane dipeptidase [Gammaproteobacteria bacterium]
MKISDKAKQIYNDSIIIDGQLAFEVDMPWSFLKKWELVDRYAKAGFTAVTLSLGNDETATEKALAYLAKIRKHIFSNSEKYILATTKNDILRAKKENKIALRLMFQGTELIDKNLDLLELFHALGVSSLIIAYNIQTAMGDGAIEENDTGLSHLGKKFVTEMNRLNMIMDGSHTGYKTTMDALNLTTKPMVISHSGVYAINPHPRNVRDDQVKAVAKTGGVIGINGLGLLLGDANASVEKFVDHIDHVTQLVGAQHVAIGLDNLYFADQFSEFMEKQSITHPQAYASKVSDATTWKFLQPEDLISVVEILLQRNYSEKDIRGILGENILRLM